MNILIASDKFKTTLSSKTVVKAIASGIQESFPEATVSTLVLSDGGEGFIEAIDQTDRLDLQPVELEAPTGSLHWGYLGVSRSNRNIYIESSQATGFHLIAQETDRNPLKTSSVGLATLLQRAIELEPETIYVGLGSSSTCDGGLPVARRFGYQFLDRHGRELSGHPTELNEIACIVKPVSPVIDPQTTLYAVADVNNPPVGEKGGVRIYSPQKGASTEEVALLEKGMKHYFSILQPDFDEDLCQLPGGGSAGCLGICLYALFGATLLSGSEWMSTHLDLKKKIEAADVVITGEGCFDAQSLSGKIPAEVVRIAKRAGKTIFVVTGKKGIPSHLQDCIHGAFSVDELIEDGTITGIQESRKALIYHGRTIGLRLRHLAIESQ